MISFRSIAKTACCLFVGGGLLSHAAFAQDMPRSAAPEGAAAYIISPEDGAVIRGGDVHVVFGLRGMGVAPAGIDYPDTGHHHLLVNADELPPLNMPIPTDETHLHFGRGQTETTLDLEPGVYSLQLLVGDKNHIPHDAPVASEKITVTVEDVSGPAKSESDPAAPSSGPAEPASRSVAPSFGPAAPSSGPAGPRDGVRIRSDFAGASSGRAPLTTSETSAGGALAMGGFYIGLEAGLSISSELDVSQSFVSHPTRCDPALYPGGGAPTDGECATENATIIADAFSPGPGFAGSAALGYALGNGLRFEAEYLHRRQGSDERLIDLGTGGDVLDEKTGEWDPNDPPTHRVYDAMTHHFFLNAWYDLRSGARLTPYVGGNVGVASTTMRYANRFLRRSDLGKEPWQMAAAGTLSDMDVELASAGWGFQAAGGVDYALSDRVSLDAKARWIRSGSFEDNDKVWTQIRNHEPVRSDGAPFASDFDVESAQRWVMTLGLRYSF